MLINESFLWPNHAGRKTGAAIGLGFGAAQAGVSNEGVAG